MTAVRTPTGQYASVEAGTRFWAMVKMGDDCWEWQGYVNAKGYGRFSPRPGVTVQAHRFAYQLDHGEIPDSLQLDHLCRNRRCVRPIHLEPVTNRTNVLRGEGFAAVNAEKAVCVNGHPFTDANTVLDRRGWRRCLICKKASSREHFRRKRAEELRLLAMLPALLAEVDRLQTALMLARLALQGHRIDGRSNAEWVLTDVFHVVDAALARLDGAS